MALSSEKARASKFNELNIQHCQYCGKECKSINSLKQHEIRCLSNPNKIPVSGWTSLQRNARKPHGWNFGLTKETDERVKAIADKASQTLKGKSKGIASTPEKEADRRKKISETMKRNGNAGGKRDGSGRGKKGTYKGFYCDSTFELVYVIYNIDHNIPFSRCNLFYEYVYDGKLHKYYPDFMLEDGSLVEIKGYMTDIVNIKLSSVKDRKINLLLEKDLKYAFDYVKETYDYKNLTDLYDN